MAEIYERIWSEMVRLINQGDGAAAFDKFEEAVRIASLAKKVRTR